MPGAGLSLYRAAASLAGVAAPLWLQRRVALGKEDPVRWREKLGQPSAGRPDGPLMWLHGASLGESLSLLALAELTRSLRPEVCVLMTCGTPAAAALLAQRAPAGVIIQFAPLDIPAAVARFLDHWRPAAAVFAESELWPNLILAAGRRGVRLALVSARLSTGSLARWRRAPGAARRVLGAFELVLARDTDAAQDLRRLGASVEGLADLKFGAAPPPADDAAVAAVRAAFSPAPVLAASTHPGEDEIILDAFAGARRSGADRLILVPRHPARGEAIATLARARGLRVERRAPAPRLTAQAHADVLVADTLGELGLWFRIARLAVLGGSLVRGVGGHNPLEPARLACPTVVGPHTEAWPVCAEIEAAGGLRRVQPGELQQLLSAAFSDDAGLADLGEAARVFVEPRDAAARAALPRLLELLPR
ncbi:MAG TPA: glycosyltransferase N-terminal domain-containing protein [Caulobacteraceae bacterium]|jgi:3-deoxy-D-manno-octulosonic-acid transferase|nr:glycosyltransferase N-terminal domain-containing protein [Caulobacteraceae bacterium]